MSRRQNSQVGGTGSTRAQPSTSSSFTEYAVIRFLKAFRECMSAVLATDSRSRAVRLSLPETFRASSIPFSRPSRVYSRVAGSLMGSGRPASALAASYTLRARSSWRPRDLTTSGKMALARSRTVLGVTGRPKKAARRVARTLTRRRVSFCCSSYTCLGVGAAILRHLRAFVFRLFLVLRGVLGGIQEGRKGLFGEFLSHPVLFVRVNVHEVPDVLTVKHRTLGRLNLR